MNFKQRNADEYDWEHTLAGPSNDPAFSAFHSKNEDSNGLLHASLFELPGISTYLKAIHEKEQEKENEENRKREAAAQRLIEQQKLAAKQKEEEKRRLLEELKKKYES